MSDQSELIRYVLQTSESCRVEDAWAAFNEMEAEIEQLRGALEKIIAVDKAAPERTDAQIWADMLEIAACAVDPSRHREKQP